MHGYGSPVCVNEGICVVEAFVRGHAPEAEDMPVCCSEVNESLRLDHGLWRRYGHRQLAVA